MNTQINIALPKEWKEELERLNGVLSIILKSEDLRLQVKHVQTVDVFRKCL